MLLTSAHMLVHAGYIFNQRLAFLAIHMGHTTLRATIGASNDNHGISRSNQHSPSTTSLHYFTGKTNNLHKLLLTKFARHRAKDPRSPGIIIFIDQYHALTIPYQGFIPIKQGFIAVHSAIHFEHAVLFSIPLALADGGAFIVLFFAFGERDFEFGPALFPVQR